MARIFISYSRADKAFVEELVPLLQPVFPEYDIFYDEHISGGEDWWRRILAEIDACDLFVYLLSNDSLESPYCQAEFREALRLRKACLPVIVRPKTDVGKAPPELAAEIRRLQWIDLADGFKNPRANARLYAAVRRLLSELPAVPPWPLSSVPVLQPDVPQPAEKSRRELTANRVALIVAMIGLVGTVAAAIITGLFGLLDNGGAPTPPTSAALVATTEAPAATEALTETPTPTVLTDPLTLPTEAPTEIDIAQIVAALNAQATLDWATWYVQETAGAPATAYAAETAMLDQTATATWWTDTPTPNITASIDAYRTQQAATATAQAIAALTVTADAWTDTPTPTLTPSDTPTPTSTPTSTPTDTPTATPTLTPLEAAMQRAANFEGSNTDWEPFATTFPDDPSGAEMVLVPVGRFMMGSEDEYDDERPAHEQVITAPCWIDRMEVTRGQYARCVAAGDCTDTPDNGYSQRDTQPINRVTWFQARDYCAWRGMRLPTEVEWEYAARGPAGWVYPYGDEWNPDNAVYSGNSGGLTADVGSRPAGASWVGALDLSGNVWEWVSSLYEGYPYNATHESKSDTNSARVLRGGSFLDSSGSLRAAGRDGFIPDYEHYRFGFRCALP